jgi:hypothetical protein
VLNANEIYDKIKWQPWISYEYWVENFMNMLIISDQNVKYQINYFCIWTISLEVMTLFSVLRTLEASRAFYRHEMPISV